MAAKLHFGPLAQVAPAGALTAREWETMARVLGELEADAAYIYLDSTNIDRTPVGVRLTRVRHALAEAASRVESKVWDALSGAGLASEDLLVLASPRIDHSIAAYLADGWIVGAPWPDITWEVTVRLFGSKSRAKRVAEALHTIDAPAAPTLSE